MRVYVLFHRSFSPRYRVPQFAPYLRERGIEVDLVRFLRSPWRRWMQLRKARDYELVVLQRRLLQPWDLAILRRASRRLIFDFDDAVMYRSSRRPDPFSRSRMLKFRKTVESCDLVLAGNSFLKEETERFVPPRKVEVIPTVVDLERYTPKVHEPREGPVTVGWIGSRGTLGYLGAIMPALEGVAERCRHVQLKIVCDHFLESRRIPIVKKRWEEETEVEDVRSFDIGVMPLSDDVWSRGKCALKIVQYLAVGIPVVCTPVGTNRDIVRHGANGFWANTHEDWVESILALVENPSLRREMGAVGRKIVAEGYSIRSVGDRLVRLMRDLVREAEKLR